MRHAEQGHEAVAEELVDRAAVAMHLGQRQLEEAVQQRVHGLGAQALGEPRWSSTMSQKRTVTCLRAPSEPARAASGAAGASGGRASGRAALAAELLSAARPPRRSRGRPSVRAGSRTGRRSGRSPDCRGPQPSQITGAPRPNQRAATNATSPPGVLLCTGVASCREPMVIRALSHATARDDRRGTGEVEAVLEPHADLVTGPAPLRVGGHSPQLSRGTSPCSSSRWWRTRSRMSPWRSAS